MDDIDSVVVASGPVLFAAVNQPEHWLVDALGGRYKPVMRVTSGGGTGLAGALAGLYQVKGGLAERVLVVAYDKLSEGALQYSISTLYDPFWGREFAVGIMGFSAAYWRARMDVLGHTEEAAAMVSVKNHRNAIRNPYAHVKKEVTVDQVLASRPLAWPIKLLDCPPISDGAAAVVLAGEQAAPRITATPAWIRGMAYFGEADNGPNRSMLQSEPLELAARHVYKAAGITNPRRQVDVVELQEPYTYFEISYYEGLGLCAPGTAAELIASGATEMDGDIPVNPSGGCMGANPIGAAGLIRLGEAAQQIRGRAGDHQVPGREGRPRAVRRRVGQPPRRRRRELVEGVRDGRQHGYRRVAEPLHRPGRGADGARRDAVDALHAHHGTLRRRVPRRAGQPEDRRLPPWDARARPGAGRLPGDRPGGRGARRAGGHGIGHRVHAHGGAGARVHPAGRRRRGPRAPGAGRRTARRRRTRRSPVGGGSAGRDPRPRGLRSRAGRPGRGRAGAAADATDPIVEKPYELDLQYRHAYGPYYGRMFDELAHSRRIVGTRSPTTGEVLLPPRAICDAPYEPTEQWVDVADTGVIQAFSIIHLEFVGQTREPPYVYVEVLLDGAATRLIHALGGIDVEVARAKLKPGMRVRAVWRDRSEAQGTLNDIEHFELIEGQL